MTIYKWENGGLRESTEFSSSCWINLVEPSTTELEAVLTHTEVPRDFLTDPLDAGERPRFDWDDDASILIVHVPTVDYSDEGEDTVVPYRTVPLGIILSKQNVITVCSARTPVTTAFLDQIRRVCPPSDMIIASPLPTLTVSMRVSATAGIASSNIASMSITSFTACTPLSVYRSSAIFTLQPSAITVS